MRYFGLRPATKEAYQLLHRGAVCFARIEQAGLRVDTAYLDHAIKTTQAEIAEHETRLRGAEEFRAWQKHFGDQMNLRSKVQLGKVIFDVLGHKRNPFMRDKNDRDQNNTAAFEHLKLPFVRDYQNVERLKTALVRNLQGMRAETVGGFIHPFQNLHTAESYRSSSNRPNFHNTPVRNKEISRRVRTAIVPRKGRKFLHMDYSTQEVRSAYWYNQDPKLLYDVEHGDMHRDRALELFKLTPEQLGNTKKGMGKEIRQQSKNLFVFREFYGGVYFQAAPDLWDSIAIHELTRGDGVSLYEHLKSVGVKGLGRCDPEFDPEPGTFEEHVRRVERRMWDEEYKVYKRWKDDWWSLYQREGGVSSLVGFRMYGVFRRNQVLCDCIQGTAFHCLLWSLIEIQNELIRRRLKTLIVNQVHDSGMLDTPDEEFDEVVEICRDVALRRVAEHFPFINCPLAMDFEVSPENWAESHELEMAV